MALGVGGLMNRKCCCGSPPVGGDPCNPGNINSYSLTADSANPGEFSQSGGGFLGFSRSGSLQLVNQLLSVRDPAVLNVSGTVRFNFATGFSANPGASIASASIGVSDGGNFGTDDVRAGAGFGFGNSQDVFGFDGTLLASDYRSVLYIQLTLNGVYETVADGSDWRTEFNGSVNLEALIEIAGGANVTITDSTQISDEGFKLGPAGCSRVFLTNRFDTQGMGTGVSSATGSVTISPPPPQPVAV